MIRRFLLLILLVVSAACLFGQVSPSTSTIASGVTATAVAQPAPYAQANVVSTYGKLPLRFEQNLGQTDPQARFIARGPGYQLFLTSREAVLSLNKPAAKRISSGRLLASVDDNAPQNEASAIVRMQLLGANRESKITQESELPTKSNYFIGNDPSRWRTNIPNYEKVRYRDVYPGIDLVYYGNQGRLEHDFAVAPGADPTRIAFNLQGASKLRVEANGDLSMQAGSGELRLLKPDIYQVLAGTRHQVAGRYVLKGGSKVGFEIAKFDSRKPLIIDPVLSYSTYLGGSERHGDYGYGIAVDSSGNAYVVGTTSSDDFPIVGTPFQDSWKRPDYPDIFVAKLSTAGVLLYSTYLGGGSDEQSPAIAVDSSENAYITGQTRSSDYPTTAGAYQSTLHGTFDAFVTKLNPTGSALLYSTFFGGSGDENVAPPYEQGPTSSIAVDGNGNAYITGNTTSPDLPVVNPAYGSLSGSTDAFVAKLDASGMVTYSTYLGGSSYDYGRGIDVDNAGNIYVTGYTTSLDFPLQNQVQERLGTIFVTKLKPDGSLPIYSTYLGNYDAGGTGNGIAVDRVSGKAYVTGYVYASLPGVSANALQTTENGGADAFVAELSSDGSALVYATYLGGSSDDFAYAIALDSLGNAYITGVTFSRDFPLKNAVQSSFPDRKGGGEGGSDVFVAKLNTDGSALLYSTYLGGGGDQDEGHGIAVDSLGAAYVIGQTNSTDFPTANAYQSTYGGGSFDAFVAKISDTSTAPVLSVTPLTLSFIATQGGSSPAAKPISIQNAGSGTLTWTASKTQSWLSLDSTSGSAPATVNVSANASGMSAGTYTDTVAYQAGWRATHKSV